MSERSKPSTRPSLGPLLALSIALSLLLVFWVTSGGRYDQSLTVSDVQRAQVIVLRKAPGQGGVHGMSLRATGQLDGQATFTLMLNDKPYSVDRADGPVFFEWGGDWYADTAHIRYEPDNVKAGSVTLHYSFRAFGR